VVVCCGNRQRPGLTGTMSGGLLGHVLQGALSTAVGERIRQLRGDRSLRSVAEPAEVSPAHWLRVERGERAASLNLLSKMEKALNVAPGTLADLAPVLHPAIEAELASTELAFAVGRGDRLDSKTYANLRRLHLRAQANAFLERVEGTARVPIDTIQLARAADLKAHTCEDTVRWPVTFDGNTAVIVGPGGTPQNRFWLAHAIGHALLNQMHCDITTVTDSELDASALASFLLIPGSELARELNFFQARNRELDPWEPTTTTGLILALASRFLVPTWLIARRLGEEGRLAEMAGVDER
jgi:transcriptional regulator with XRE-family HTH domain